MSLLRSLPEAWCGLRRGALRGLLCGALASCLPLQGLAFDGDPLRFSLSASRMHDSNVFRLPDGYPVAALTGRAQRGDSMTQLGAMLAFDRTLRRQHIAASLNVTDTRYATYRQLDSVGYDLAANWRLEHRSDSSLALSLRKSRVMSGFADFRAALKNMVDTEAFDVASTTQVLPRWAVIANGGHARFRNDTEIRRPLDLDLGYLEAGLRFDWLTGSNWDLVWRASNGRYPNHAAGTGASSGYREQQLLTRLSWVPTPATRLQGQLGWLGRREDGIQVRDFSGPTARLIVDWRVSDKLTASGSLRNELSSYQDLTSSYAVMRGIGLGAVWGVTEKTSVRGSVDWLRRSFGGDPGLLRASPPGREDLIRAGVIALAVHPVSWLELSAELRRESRRSNWAGADYDANVLLLKLAFRN